MGLLGCVVAAKRDHFPLDPIVCHETIAVLVVVNTLRKRLRAPLVWGVPPVLLRATFSYLFPSIIASSSFAMIYLNWIEPGHHFVDYSMRIQETKTSKTDAEIAFRVR